MTLKERVPEFAAQNEIGSKGNRDGFAATAPVGSFAPNPFGLFDMGGNVLEWCETEYSPGSGIHLLRGGSFVNDDLGNLRSSYRFAGAPEISNLFLGFRVVLADKP